MFHEQTEPTTTGTVQLSPTDIRDAIRLLSMLLDATTRSPPGAESRNSGEPERSKLRARASELLKISRLRREHFAPSMFGEPAWEILMTLYLNDARFTVTRLGEYTGLPVTTTVRWVNYLEKEKLIARNPHPTDMRMAVIELTTKGRERLDRYFSEILTLSP